MPRQSYVRHERPACYPPVISETYFRISISRIAIRLGIIRPTGVSRLQAPKVPSIDEPSSIPGVSKEEGRRRKSIVYYIA